MPLSLATTTITTANDNINDLFSHSFPDICENVTNVFVMLIVSLSSSIIYISQRLTSLFTKKDLCTAFSSIEPSTRTANCSDSHDDRMYHVPIYDAVTLPQPRDGDHSLLSPNEVTLDTGLLQEEVNLSMGEGEDLHGCPKTEAASERGECNLCCFDLLREKARNNTNIDSFNDAGGGAISRYPDGTTIKR